MKKTILAGWLTAICLTSFVAPARAERPDPSAADALFRSAREAMARGEHAVACARFAESQRLDPAVGTLLNLAACEEIIGKLASSETHLLQAIDRLSPRDPRYALAQERHVALKSRVPRVTVLAPAAPRPEGLIVQRDDIELREGSFGAPLPLDPGTYTFTVRAPGREPRRETVTIREGDRLRVELAIGPIPAGATTLRAPDDRGARVPTPGDSATRTRALGFGALGVGAAGIVTGLVSGLMLASAASTYRERCDASGCDGEGLAAASRGKTLEVVSPVAFGIGAVGIGVGSYLLVRANREARQTPKIGIATAVVPGSASFSLSGSF